MTWQGKYQRFVYTRRQNFNLNPTNQKLDLGKHIWFNNYLVFPGIGTGADSNFKIHVSISRTSCKTIDDAPSPAWPVKTLQTLSLKLEQPNKKKQFSLLIPACVNYLDVCLEAPTLLGFDDSLQASISFFNIKRHSRNIVKKGWCERMHSDVNEWFRIRWKGNSIFYDTKLESFPKRVFLLETINFNNEFSLYLF